MYRILNEKEIEEQRQRIDDMSPEEYDQFVLSRGFDDTWFFADYFLETFGYIITEERVKNPWYFELIWSKLDAGEDINLILPRWHAKTTAVLIWILKQLCYAKVRKLLYIAAKTLWQQGIGKLRWELETNKEIRRLFGNLVPANSDNVKDKRLKRWRDSELELLNGTSVQTLSKWEKVRGQRPNKILFDDPQDNKEVKNRKLVKEFNERVFTSLYNTLLPGGSMCVLWTIIGKACLVLYLKNTKKRPTLERVACDENYNNVLRPEMWSAQSLRERKEGKMVINPDTGEEQRKEGIGTANFNQEFRNIPISSEDALIKDERIKYWTKDMFPERWDRIILGIDPAQKEKEASDPTGVCVVAFSGEKAFVFSSKSIKLSPMKNEAYIEEQYKLYNPDRVVKEDNVEAGITEHLKDKWLRVQSVTATVDKYTRLLEVAPKIEFGNVYFNTTWCGELIYQLTTYPDVEHDDEMDAFVRCLLSKKRTRAVWVKQV